MWETAPVENADVQQTEVHGMWKGEVSMSEQDKKHWSFLIALLGAIGFGLMTAGCLGLV